MNKKIKTYIQLLLSGLPGIVKIAIYKRIFGARIGKGVKIGFGAILIFDSLEMGDFVCISSLCVVRARELKLGKRVRIGMLTRISTYSVNLGSSVTVGSQVSILASTENPQCTFKAGPESWIFDYCYINPERPINLGRNVGVGGGSYIFAHGLWLSKLKGYPVSYGEITIGNDVWLPWGCFIMPGISIGDGAVIGARSVVTKNIPAGSLAAGSPAKVIREVAASEPSEEMKNQMLDEITKDFCRFNNFKLDVEKRSDWLYYRIEGVVEIAIANKSKIGLLPLDEKNALFVVHDKYPNIDFFNNKLFSLSSYQSSPRIQLDGTQMSWLLHLRNIGSRFYPVDEVDLSS